MMPTTIPGVTPVNGKPNPVTLVSNGRQEEDRVPDAQGRFPAIISNTAMKPATIAIRLMMTWIVV